MRRFEDKLLYLPKGIRKGMEGSLCVFGCVSALNDNNFVKKGGLGSKGIGL